jgi:hypothetical protein
MEPHTTFNHAALDSEAEIVAEELRLTVAQGQRVVEWRRRQEAQSTRATQADQLGRVCQFFLAEGQNARLAAVALCFAAGLNRRIRWNSMRDAAKELGYTVAEISKLTLKAQDALGLPRNLNNKRAEHAGTYSAVQAANPWRSRKFKL